MKISLTKHDAENLIKALQVAVIVQSTWWHKHCAPEGNFKKLVTKSSKKFAACWQQLACKIIKQSVDKCSENGGTNGDPCRGGLSNSTARRRTSKATKVSQRAR